MKSSLRQRVSLFLLVASLPVTAAEQASRDVFRNDAARLELHRPAGWHVQSLESALTNRAAVKLNDEEFQKAVERMATAPLLIATRHEEPYDKLNPSFQVIVRPAGPLEGKTGAEILRLVAPTLQAQFADFREVDAVREIAVGGRGGARMTLRYTLKTHDGREFPTQATIVMVPRGKVLYQLGFSGPPDGPDAITTEVDAVLGSVKFLE